eukprot:jgi/Tetstr1/433970/TSEL_023147.t1
MRLELGPTWATDLGTVMRAEFFHASLAVVGATTAAYVIGVMMQKIKSLRKGATTAAYVIGVMMQKIK